MACAMLSIPVSTEAPRSEPEAVLSLRGLSVTFDTPQGPVPAVQEATLSVQ